MATTVGATRSSSTSGGLMRRDCASATAASARWRASRRMPALDVSRADSCDSCDVSACTWPRAASMAVRCACRPCSEASSCARARCRIACRVCASWCMSASFSGFGGIGGAGTLVGDGIDSTRGSSMRSGGGGGFCAGCCGGAGGAAMGCGGGGGGGPPAAEGG